MPGVKSQLIIRLGSHAEKEYIEKTAPFLDGVMIGSNLIESTPGATASLAVRLVGASRRHSLKVIIDPMTYAFGTYRDDFGRQRTDLDWIKSDQKIKGQKDKTERKLKRSYSRLAMRLGSLFADATMRDRAILPADLASPAARHAVCAAVIDYQTKRLPEEFAKDEDFAGFAGELPQPSFVFAPYFYVDPTLQTEWIEVGLQLAEATVDAATGHQVHAVFCANDSVLSDATLLDRLVSKLPDTGVKGVWLWFSSFDELQADVSQLASFRSLVERLSARMTVYNMHGGFFSLALTKSGLSGVVHGIGYGEQKNVIPVIGQSTPTVRYYFPPLRRRLGIPEIQVALKRREIESAAKFIEEICNCVVCRGVLDSDLDQLAQFGDMHFSTPQSQRMAQTPAAAKRCRYHFILRRIAERDWIRSADLGQISAELASAEERWAGLPTLSQSAKHMRAWRQALAGSVAVLGSGRA